jgi:lysophospholipase L1-like esterase
LSLRLYRFAPLQTSITGFELPRPLAFFRRLFSRSSQFLTLLFPMKKTLLFGLSLLWLAGCHLADRSPSSGQTSALAPTSAVAKADPFWPVDGVFPGKGTVSSWPGFKPHNLERRTLFAQRQQLDQDALVFVGDSITDGWNTLNQDFADLHVKVANRGIGGDTTPNLLYRLQDDILSLHPRALVILIGTNDLGQHTPVADIADNLRELHRRIRAAYPKIPIAWCLVMPRGGEDNFPQRIHDLNTEIEKIAANDRLITICDTFQPLATSDGTSKAEDFVPDHLHPNAAGYAVWRSVLFPILSGWNLSAQ